MGSKLFMQKIIRSETFTFPILQNLDATAPDLLHGIGNTALLNHPLDIIFASRINTADEIYDTVRKASRLSFNQEIATISGFQSPLELRTLRILLDAKSPVIYCPVLGLHHLQLDQDLPIGLYDALLEDRALILSFFPLNNLHINRTLCLQRNTWVKQLSPHQHEKSSQ